MKQVCDQLKPPVTDKMADIADGNDSGHFSLDEEIANEVAMPFPAGYPDHVWVNALPNQVIAAPPGGDALLGMPSCAHCQRNMESKIRHYLLWSIFTLLIAPPFGLIALVSSLKTRRLLRQDPHCLEAIKTSHTAFNSNIAGALFLFLLLLIVGMVVMVEGVRHGTFSQSSNQPVATEPKALNPSMAKPSSIPSTKQSNKLEKKPTNLSSKVLGRHQQEHLSKDLAASKSNETKLHLVGENAPDHSLF